jgi:hypothetical protein
MTITCDSAEWIESRNFTQAPSAILEARSRDKSYGTYNYPASYGFGKYTYPNLSSGVRREIMTVSKYTLMACVASGRDYLTGINRNTNYSVYRITWTPSICHLYENDVQKDVNDVTTNIPMEALKVNVGRNFYVNELNTFDMDWIRVRKYASTEPGYSMGGEQTNGTVTTTTTSVPDTTTTTVSPTTTLASTTTTSSTTTTTKRKKNAWRTLSDLL